MLARVLAGGIALVVGWLATAGCGHSCNDMGCTSGLDVSISSSKSLESGAYVLQVTTPFESETFTCNVAAQSPLECDCSPTAKTLSGCVTASGISVSVGGKPSTISLRLTSDGAELGTWSYTPHYETYHPNGTSCDPACEVAHESGTL